MASGVPAYIAQVDRVLAAGEGLFPQAGPTVGPLATGGSTVSAAPEGASGLAQGSATADQRYRGSWGHVGRLDDEAGSVATAARLNGDNGRAGAATIRENARTTAAAIAPATSSPAGMRMLVSAMDQRLSEMQGQIRTTKGQNGALTSRMLNVASDYRSLGRQPSTAGPDDQIVGDDPDRHGVVPVDNTTGVEAPAPPRPGTPVDPTQWQVGDSRFGRWETVPPAPPYVGDSPPPLKDEVRKFPEDTPYTVGPTTGMYTPGKTWIGDIDPPAVQSNEEYKFRWAGEEATTQTRMVQENGQWVQQRWVQNLYEYQRNTQLVVGGDLGFRGIDGQGGDIGALTPPPKLDLDWKPISMRDIGNLSAANPDVTYYLPDGCGGTIRFNDASPGANPFAPPTPPQMHRPR